MLKRSFIPKDRKELLTLLLTQAQCQLASRDSSILLMRQLAPTYASQGFAYARVLMAASLLAAPECREQKGVQQRRDDFRNILSDTIQGLHGFHYRRECWALKLKTLEFWKPF